MRLATTRYLTGRPLSNTERVALRSDGWPKMLGNWIEGDHVKSDPLLAQLLLTVLSIGRAFTTKPVLDVESIVTPSKADLSEINPFELK